MIKGAEKTPYEDGLFFFDFQLSADYPKAPPICFYHRYVLPTKHLLQKTSSDMLLKSLKNVRWQIQKFRLFSLSHIT